MDAESQTLGLRMELHYIRQPLYHIGTSLTAHTNTKILCCQNPDNPEVSAACLTGPTLAVNSSPTPS